MVINFKLYLSELTLMFKFWWSFYEPFQNLIQMD